MRNKGSLSMVLILVICLIILVYFLLEKERTVVREGFVWSKQTLADFKQFQRENDENVYQYNMNIIQDQASDEDVADLVRTGHWKWSNETKKQYKDVIAHHPILKITPDAALLVAQKKYPENAIKQSLYWNSPEGKFVLYGGNLGSTLKVGLEKISNTLRCVLDKDDGITKMVKTVYMGFNRWNGFKNSTSTIVKNEDIPEVMPGFSFENGACNPCGALDNDYSCKFKIHE